MASASGCGSGERADDRCGVHHLGGEKSEVGEGSVVGLVTEGRDCIAYDDGPEAVVDCITNLRLDAEVRNHAGNHDGVDPTAAELIGHVAVHR